MKAVNFYLNFDGNTDEAFSFYQSVFGGDLTEVVRFKDMDMGDMKLPEEDLDKIANIGLPLGDDTVLMGADILESLGHSLNVGNNVYIVLEVDSADEGERLFDALSSGGVILRYEPGKNVARSLT